MDAIVDAVYDGDFEGLQTALETFPHGLDKPFELGRLLSVAMDHNHLACFNLLLDNGAAQDVFNVDGDTLLHEISSYQDEKMPYLEVLAARGCEPYLEIPLENGMTPFHAACMKRNFPVAQRLLQLGADVRNRSDVMKTPLHDAASGEIVELILNNGGDADLEAVDTDGFRPLHCACSRSSLASVQVLINGGALVNATDNMERTPLHIACRYGEVDTINALLAAGADARLDDVRDNTPLHSAVASTITDVETQRVIVDRLIEARCNPRIGNSSLERPDVVAVHPQISNYLKLQY